MEFRSVLVLAISVSFAAFECVLCSGLPCQPPSRYSRVLHVQDLSPDMKDTIAALADALPNFTSWMNSIFDMSVGLGTFTDKSIVTGFDDDYCWNLTCPLNANTSHCVDMYNDLQVIGDSSVELQRSQLDALFGASYSDWNSALDRGRRIIILFTSVRPRMFTTLGLTDFPDNGTMKCDFFEYPKVNQVVGQFLDEGLRLIILTSEDEVEYYEWLFAALGSSYTVKTLSIDPDDLYQSLVSGVQDIYCGKTISTTTFAPTFRPTTATAPTFRPTTAPILFPTTTEIFTRTATAEESQTQFTSTTASTCAESTTLQLLHLQDVSWSYTNDLANLKLKFPPLLSQLAEDFFERQVALGTFVDKPVAPVGYWSDYCFREEVGMNTDVQQFLEKLNGTQIRSGRDWKESQLDAVKYGVTSGTVGWVRGDASSGRHTLRVVMVATDAGPHRKGDLPSQPGTPDGCAFEDYPSFDDVHTLLVDNEVYPIFVVTSDIFIYWTNIMKNQLSNIGKVLMLSDPDGLVSAIKDALEELCQVSVQHSSIR